MPTGIFTNAWIIQSAKILYRGTTPPDASKFRLCLANTAALTRTSPVEDFISSELVVSNGYGRASANFSGDGSYDTGDQRHEMPVVNASFAAVGGALQFQTVFLMADAVATPSKSFTNAEVNPTTDTITITNHGFSDGDKLVFTADTLATLPSGINASTIYQVAGATTNTFTLQLDGGGSTINITDTGSGTFRSRSANGIIVAYAIESNPITVPDGQGYSYQIPLVVLNSGYVSGA